MRFKKSAGFSAGFRLIMPFNGLFIKLSAQCANEGARERERERARGSENATLNYTKYFVFR